MKLQIKVIFILSVAFTWSCQSIKNILIDDNPRKAYVSQFEKTALADKAIFKKWLINWDQAKINAQEITVPYLEQGIFYIADAKAYGYKFKLKEGEKLEIELNSDTPIFGELYLDENTNKTVDFIKDQRLSIEIKKTGTYILVLQNDFLEGGKFELKINTSATLNFPVSGANYKDVGSFWGAARDGGKRSHKGVDIFAERGTPVVAVTGGVARAKQNNLGGKVVWLYNAGEGKSYYYAHLDSQLVKGNIVTVGDTLGFVGNTGNAKYTPPHLHFGIYGSGGAVDPFPFINDKVKSYKTIETDLAAIGNYFTVNSTTANIRNQPNSTNNTPITSLSKNSIVQVISATEDWYKIRFNESEIGYVFSSLVNPFSSANVELNGKYLISDEFEIQPSDTLEISDTINVIQLAENKFIDAKNRRFKYTKTE